MENKVIKIKDGALSMVESFTQFLQAIEEGWVKDEDIVDALIKVACAEKAIAEFKGALKPYTLRALEMLTDKTTLDLGDAYIKVTTTATKYDYSYCADWNAAKTEEDKCAKKRKAIEKALQDADINEYVDKTSGEIITTKPAKVSGGEKTIAVTFRKE